MQPVACSRSFEINPCGDIGMHLMLLISCYLAPCLFTCISQISITSNTISKLRVFPFCSIAAQKEWVVFTAGSSL